MDRLIAQIRYIMGVPQNMRMGIYALMFSGCDDIHAINIHTGKTVADAHVLYRISDIELIIRCLSK